MATRGDQGAAVIAGEAKARLVTTDGSKDKYLGMGGGPSGLPMFTFPRARFTVDFFFCIGLPLAEGKSPKSIHFLIRSISGCGILSSLWGM